MNLTLLSRDYGTLVDLATHLQHACHSTNSRQANMLPKSLPLATIAIPSSPSCPSAASSFQTPLEKVDFMEGLRYTTRL